MKGRDLNERCMLEQWVLLRPLLTLWQEASPLLFGKFSSGPSLNSCCPVRPAAASQAAPRLAVTFAMSRPIEGVQRRVGHSQRVKLHWVFLFCLSAEHLWGGERRFVPYSHYCSIIMWETVETQAAASTLQIHFTFDLCLSIQILDRAWCRCLDCFGSHS